MSGYSAPLHNFRLTRQIIEFPLFRQRLLTFHYLSPTLNRVRLRIYGEKNGGSVFPRIPR